MKLEEFTYVANPARVIFGAGSLQHLEREIELLGVRRALILTTPRETVQGMALADRLGARAAGCFHGATMHVPGDVARQACDLATRLDADCAVAIGGGSTIGLGKAIALESGLPIIAIPTTYAGSEMTPIYGITDCGIKRTGIDRRVLPRTVIYDPELTLTLPPAISVTSSLNAIAHAAEGLYSRDINPVMALIAEEGIRSLARALPKLQSHPGDMETRSHALYGAWSCGMVLGCVGMALHHKLCHTLGGSFNLPHAETHAVVLPHALAYNAAFATDAMTVIARATGSLQAASGLFDLARKSGSPVSLRELGMREIDLDRAADLACANPYWNPRPIERAPIRVLLQHAFEGMPPQVS